MSAVPKNMEAPGQQPDPVILLENLNGMDTDQKKYNQLRDIFVKEADVDEYIQFLDTDEDIDLTKRQLTQLKATLEGYKVYLKDYLKQTGERIGRFDERLKTTTEEMANPDLTREDVRRVAHTRERVAQAMQIAKAPRGAKGKSLREVTQNGPVSGIEVKKELSPEEIDKYLGEFRTRFDALPQLHKGIEWAEVEKALRADVESMAKLYALDEKGHKMNVFGEENGEFVFASAWNDYEKVAEDHRNICFDPEGQKLAEKHGYEPKGNAVSIIAAIMGVKEDEARDYLADPKFHEQLRKAVKVNGWAWLKTDAATRKSGDAFDGYYNGIYKDNADSYNDVSSFRASLRVKKA